MVGRHGGSWACHRYRPVLRDLRQPLGSCFGSTGPGETNPETGRLYGTTFPELSMEDLAKAAHDVVTSLGITTLHGLVGPPWEA